MAIFLKFEHVDGIKLRQQLAQDVKRHDKENTVTAGKDWRFEKDPITGKDAHVARDIDPRTQEPLNTYSPTVNFGTKNLVLEKAGKGENINFRNSSVRNQLRLKAQELKPTGKTTKEGDVLKSWQDVGTSYLSPQAWGGVFVGDGQRVIIDEMPT